MNQERIFKVVLSPQISEKATVLAEAGQFVFRVAKDATKPEIKSAIEQLFEVKVKSVQTVVMKGKTKRFGRHFGRRSDWKKAYVSLQEGYDIDVLGVD
jgi:large subunit ribosomal protein L23